ncbi:MAG: hypothetical protein JSW25_07535 [Thermoplasmata archaeon]|nr:MAG: hypothetical protein JSW25_07535 [Thermoplasmata archaeon]
MRCRHCGADYEGGRCGYCGSDEFVDVVDHYHDENLNMYRSGGKIFTETNTRPMIGARVF